MAAAEVATFHNIINAHMDNVEFAKKAAPIAPPSPDGADLPQEPAKSLPVIPEPAKLLPSTLPISEPVAVPKPTLPVPSQASRALRMEKKLQHEAESRKVSIRRLASRAFERQTGKQFTGDDDMSAKEWEIYNAEVKKSEEILDRKQAEEDAAALLINNIKFHETQLEQMQSELGKKVEQYQLGQEELVKVTKDFEDAVQQRLASTPRPTDVKSSAIRMQEAQEKKALKAAWRRSTSDDPLAQARQRQFAAAEEITHLKARIEEARKELGRMMGQAQKGKSSLHRMREEKAKKEAKRLSGVPAGFSAKEDAPVKVYVKKEPAQRSHQQRMQEEQAKKAELRKQQRMSLDVTDIVGRARSDTATF